MAKTRRKVSLSGRLNRLLEIYAAHMGYAPERVIEQAIKKQLVADIKEHGLKGPIAHTYGPGRLKDEKLFLGKAKKLHTWEKAVEDMLTPKPEKAPKLLKEGLRPGEPS